MTIKLIIGVLILAVAVILFYAAFALRAKKNLTIVLVSFALACLIVFCLVPGSVFSISTGELGVVKVFGEAKEIVYPGINFRLWVTNSVERYDIKTREINLEFQAYSKDAQTVTGQLAVQYQIKPDMVMEINRQFGSIEVLEQKLKAVVTERAKSVFSDKGAMNIVETRSSLSGEIEQRITPALEQYHVAITMVALADISFNDAFENAVELKMIAEQEKLRADYDKERAIIKAEEQLAVAEREAKAVIQKAQGDAEALRIMQDAWSSLSSEVKEAMLRQIFYEKWNGVLPEVMTSDNIDFIIGTRPYREPSAAE